MKYNIDMKFNQMIENEQAAAIFDACLPGVRAKIEGVASTGGLALRSIIKYMQLPGGDTLAQQLEAGLQKLNTPENRISPGEAKQMAQFRQMEQVRQQKAAAKAEAPATHYQDAIYPGKMWLDTAGERIQAHGAAMYREGDIYCWYGENKEYTDGKNGIWTWGIRLYTSKDLYNWTDCGLMIPPVLDDPESGLFPTKRLDRPHILKCEKTGKYVCWIKLSGAEAAFVILQADAFAGPYTLIKDMYRPEGVPAGDFDLVQDEESGEAYLYYDAGHSALVGMVLAEDYLSAETTVSRQYENLNPPFTREGPAAFAVNGKKYLFTSGMTGYVPNRSDCAISEGWRTPFTSLGNPHRQDTSGASFNSQISKVFKVGEAGPWIAMADRWVPEYLMDSQKSDLFTRTIASHYAPEQYTATQAEQEIMQAAPSLETANTAIADYVWLPVSFDETGRLQLIWQEKWRVDGAQ